MKRDPRLWFPLAFLAAGSLPTVAAPLLPKLARRRPTELEPARAEAAAPENRPDVPPRLKVLYLEFGLQFSAPGVRLASGDAPGSCLALNADPAAVAGVPPTEEYADCWRGAVLCLADPSPGLPTGPHSRYAGDFWLFGDVELMEKVRPAAEAVHFGPWQGVGGPAQTP